MNFRQLIEKAMHEAKDEFAAIVAQKLAALMGDDGSPRASARGSRGPAQRSVGRPRGSGKGSNKGRAAPEHMSAIQEKILDAMKAGQPMKKSAIMKAARLPDHEETRVRNVLAKLKTAGVLSMKGVRGSAVYILKG